MERKQQSISRTLELILQTWCKVRHVSDEISDRNELVETCPEKKNYHWNLPFSHQTCPLIRTSDHCLDQVSHYHRLMMKWVTWTWASKDNKYGLLTKCEVKMAGYWPSSFFASLWTLTSSRSINTQKKNEAETKQTWSIKDLLYGFWGNFARGIQRVVPSGQDRSILPARVANHSARFCSSCPLAELGI